MRILFVSAWFPEPPSNGSRLRIHHLLRTLAAQHAVTLLSFADQPDADAEAALAPALCQRVRVLPLPRFDAGAWRSRMAWLAPRPRSLVATFSPAMAGAITAELAAGHYDAVVASQLSCAVYQPRFGSVPALFEEVELGWLDAAPADATPLARWRFRLMRAKYRRYLRRLLPRFRACTVVSERERELLAGVVGDAVPIHVVPNAVAADEYAPGAPEPDTVIFTGSLLYGPNHAAMDWFIGAVWPRVLAARPAVRLVITGADGDRALPPAANVVRVGFVDDVRARLAASCVAVAPILSGGGTRLKILEAMAVGTPVVATRKGAEGIDARPDAHLIIADEPDSFAAGVLRLLADAALRARLAGAARALVAARYDWRVVGPRFEALVRAVATGTDTM
jgi:glycosyltransferase involved in cell wall biosynthesis